MKHSIDEFLEHHGVKGQKWGFRNRGKSGGSSSSSSHPPAHSLSDDEIRKAISRMQMDRQYSALVKEKNTKSGAATVGTVLAKNGGKIVASVATAYTANQVRKILETGGSKVVAKVAAKKAAKALKS